MQATVGDRLIIKSHHLGEPDRDALTGDVRIGYRQPPDGTTGPERCGGGASLDAARDKRDRHR